MILSCEAMIEKVEQLEEEKKFIEALAEIDKFSENSLLSEQDKRVLAYNKASLYYAQGYCNRALSVVNDALDKSAWTSAGRVITSEECAWHNLLYAQAALMLMETTGDIDYGLQARAELWPSLGGAEPSVDYNRQVISLTNHLPSVRSLRWSPFAQKYSK